MTRYEQGTLVKVDSSSLDMVEQPWPVAFVNSKAALASVFGFVFLVLLFNAYYLKKKQSVQSDMSRSVFWMNVLVAILVIVVTCLLFAVSQAEFVWDQTMMTT